MLLSHSNRCRAYLLSLRVCLGEIVMLVIGWSLFYIVVLILKSVNSLSRNRELNYYDGSRGRMDSYYYTHDEFFQRNNRPKRTPHSPNLWAKSSESQGVSCPTRLRENNLDMMGDSDRAKEVVHIPCPKRKSSGGKVVASFKGKSSFEKYHKGNRGARELFRKNARMNDLNQAVKENAQWLILSSQDRVQKPNQGHVEQNINPANMGQAGRNRGMSQPSNDQGMPTLEHSAAWRNPKGAKEEHGKTQYSKAAQYPLQSGASQLKPSGQAPQSSFNAPPLPRLKDGIPMLERFGQQFPLNQGYYNLGPPRNVQSQVPQVVPNQGPYPRKDKPQNPYETNRLLMNSYNMTYDGPHHSGSPNPHNYNVNPPNPSGQLPEPQGQMNPSYFQSHVTPAGGIPFSTYLIVYNATLPSETPKMLQNTNETRIRPWAPGSLEVDIPPGYPHQPKLPKTTTRSFDAVNIKDLPKADQKIPGLNSLPSFSKYDIQGGQYPYQSYPSDKPHSEYGRYNDKPYDNNQLQNSNMARPEPQGNSYDNSQLQNSNMARPEPPGTSHGKPGVTPLLEKTTPALKGVFGKFKKEESKVKLSKPNKIAAARVPVGVAQGGLVPPHGGNVMSNSRPDKFAPQQDLRPRLQNSLAFSEAIPFHNEPKITNSKAVIPFRKTSSSDMDHQDNFSGNMSHILNPPVTMDANLYTNKAHKIASKFVNSEEVTYVPFRGVPPARNDEAFYDKNLNFLGKIDRPPLVNIKRHKWTKLNRRFNGDRSYKRLREDYPVGLYSEPVDFHSDMSVEDSASAHGPKSADRHFRKCHHKPAHGRSQIAFGQSQ